MTDYNDLLLFTLKRCKDTGECPPECMYADNYGGCRHEEMVTDIVSAIESIIKDRDFWKDVAIKAKKGGN